MLHRAPRRGSPPTTRRLRLHRVAIAKQKSGFDFAMRDGYRLWQKGYYERVLRDEEASAEIIRYILANPVRSGLVAEPAEYPFWALAFIRATT